MVGGVTGNESFGTDQFRGLMQVKQSRRYIQTRASVKPGILVCYWDTRDENLTSTWAQFTPRGVGHKNGVVKFQAIAELTRPKFILIVRYHSDPTWVLLRLMLRLSTSGNLVRCDLLLQIWLVSPTRT